jgi:hypothetical protein
MIVGLAVAMVACQGAVGKAGEKGEKGEKGDKGDPGTTGTPGTPGTPGINALVATGGTATIPVNNDADNADSVGDTPADWDVSEYFTGGAGELTYKDGGEVNADLTEDGDSYYEVTVSPAGIASLSVRDISETGAGIQPGDPDDTEAALFVRFVVTATDENGIEASKTVVVQRNIAPAVVTGTQIEVTGGVGTQDAANPSEMETVTMVRPNLNEFVVEVDIVASDATDADAAHFTDADPDSVMITAESSDSSVASVAVDGHKVIVTGHKGTDTDATTETPGPVTITVKATDARSMTSEGKTFTVAVVAAPKAKSSIGAQTYNVGTETSLVNNIGEFFDPTVDDNLITAKSSDDTKLEIASTAVSGSNLQGTPKNPGEVTITVTATDAIGQFATQTFQATVKRP